MERAEAGADAAVGCLLDDAKLALENRFDWKATVESLVGAANAAKTDPTEEGKRAAEDRVRLLWGSLMQKCERVMIRRWSGACCCCCPAPRPPPQRHPPVWP